MLNTEAPKNYILPPREEPLRPMRLAPISGYDRERMVRPRRYTRPVVRGGMRGASRGSWVQRENWREYGVRARRDEFGLRGRGSVRGDWGIRGRERGEWNIRGRTSYGELGWRDRRRDDITSFRRRGMNMRGMRIERIRGGRDIPRGPRGYRR